MAFMVTPDQYMSFEKMPDGAGEIWIITHSYLLEGKLCVEKLLYDRKENVFGLKSRASTVLQFSIQENPDLILQCHPANENELYISLLIISDQ